MRIYNKSDLDQFLNQYTSKLNNNQHKNLFNKKFRKLIVNDKQYLSEPKLEPNTDIDTTNLMTFNPDKKLKDQLDHIFDMIRDPDLPENQFKKLTGVQSIEQAYQVADNYFASKNKQISDDEDYSGLKEVMSFSDGFKLVQLKTKKCLDREGKLMGHCVGSYGEKVENESLTVLSLRDTKNNPHATIGIENKKVIEIKGNGNAPIIEKYRPYIRKYLDKTNYEVEDDELLNAGLIKINDKIYDYNKLPKGLTIKSKLNLENTNISSLPDNLEVDGNLNIRNTKIKSLPEGLTIKGSLFLEDTKISSLPNNLKIGGNLDLRNTNISELPDNLEVGGNLNLYNTNISSLPDNLKVGGNLNLYNTNISSLPDNLKVGGDLDLDNTNISSLPDNLKVDGNLFLNNTNISSLPNNLEVGKNLDLRNTNISSLPNNLKVGGNLDIENTKISSLPDNLEVGVSLYIKNTPLSKKYTKEEIKQIIKDKGGRDINVNI